MLTNNDSNIHDDAVYSAAKGLQRVANTVKYTIGTGRHVDIEQDRYPFYISTKDSYSIIQSINLANPVENQAVRKIKDAADSHNKRTKDGRTAMVLIANALMSEILHNPKYQNIPRKKIIEDLKALLPEVKKEIFSQRKSITVKSVKAVAMTAANDKTIGELVQKVYSKIGQNGMIDIESSGMWEDVVTYIEGMRFPNCGLISEALTHGNKDGILQAVYEKPSILVAKRRIEKVSQIDQFLFTLHTQSVDSPYSKDLIIFYDFIAPEVLSDLIAAHSKKTANICLIKAPVIMKDAAFEDFAKVTGAKIIGDETGITWKKVPLNALGTCDKIIVERNEVRIIGGKNIKEHLARLATSKIPEDKYRIHWLTTKTAVIKLGALNEGELSLRRLNTTDAVSSSALALQDGVVCGGGVCLWEVAKRLEKTNSPLVEALKAPIKQIIENAGMKPEEILPLVSTQRGLNGKTGKIENLVKSGIVDSTMVVYNCVQNAVGLVTMMLDTSAYITLPIVQKQGTQDDKLINL